nr:hypothetical protein BaRGS_028244 [Batillaria attramentaria]
MDHTAGQHLERTTPLDDTWRQTIQMDITGVRDGPHRQTTLGEDHTAGRHLETGHSDGHHLESEMGHATGGPLEMHHTFGLPLEMCHTTTPGDWPRH